MKRQDRIEWIDVAKGIGIILVIMGHTFQLDLVSPIYAFHMPLFFFLSGLLFNLDAGGGICKKEVFTNIKAMDNCYAH